MRRNGLFAGVVLAAAIMVPLTGCATGGKARVSMAKMCQAHGGTWSQAAETCGMSAAGSAAASKSAASICAEQGGSYLPGGTCVMGDSI